MSVVCPIHCCRCYGFSDERDNLNSIHTVMLTEHSPQPCVILRGRDTQWLCPQKLLDQWGRPAALEVFFVLFLVKRNRNPSFCFLPQAAFLCCFGGVYHLGPFWLQATEVSAHSGLIKKGNLLVQITSPQICSGTE